MDPESPSTIRRKAVPRKATRHGASGLALGALLTQAAHAIGDLVHAPGEGKTLIFVGMVVAYRLLWAKWPGLMRLIETDPATHEGE